MRPRSRIHALATRISRHLGRRRSDMIGQFSINGIRVRPARDEIRIDAGLPVRSSLDLTISNPYKRTVLGPWRRKTYNRSIEGKETRFLKDVNEFDGIGGPGKP